MLGRLIQIPDFVCTLFMMGSLKIFPRDICALEPSSKKCMNASQDWFITNMSTGEEVFMISGVFMVTLCPFDDCIHLKLVQTIFAQAHTQ